MTPSDLLALAQILLVCVAILALAFTIVGGIAFWRTEKGGAKTFTLFIQRGDALRILTVVLIVIAASFLALAHVIEGTAVVAILSGIAGYVLGGLRGTNAEKDDPVSTAS